MFFLQQGNIGQALWLLPYSLHHSSTISSVPTYRDLIFKPTRISHLSMSLPAVKYLLLRELTSFVNDEPGHTACDLLSEIFRYFIACAEDSEDPIKLFRQAEYIEFIENLGKALPKIESCLFNSMCRLGSESVVRFRKVRSGLQFLEEKLVKDCLLHDQLKELCRSDFVQEIDERLEHWKKHHVEGEYTGFPTEFRFLPETHTWWLDQEIAPEKTHDGEVGTSPSSYLGSVSELSIEKRTAQSLSTSDEEGQFKNECYKGMEFYCTAEHQRAPQYCNTRRYSHWPPYHRISRLQIQKDQMLDPFLKFLNGNEDPCELLVNIYTYSTICSREKFRPIDELDEGEKDDLESILHISLSRCLKSTKLHSCAVMGQNRLDENRQIISGLEYLKDELVTPLKNAKLDELVNDLCCSELARETKRFLNESEKKCERQKSNRSCRSSYTRRDWRLEPEQLPRISSYYHGRIHRLKDELLRALFQFNRHNSDSTAYSILSVIFEYCLACEVGTTRPLELCNHVEKRKLKRRLQIALPRIKQIIYKELDPLDSRDVTKFRTVRSGLEYLKDELLDPLDDSALGKVFDELYYGDFIREINKKLDNWKKNRVKGRQTDYPTALLCLPPSHDWWLEQELNYRTRRSMAKRQTF